MLAASCSNDEVVNVAPQSGAIGFSSFVNNSTRATDKDLSNLENLQVWGYSYRAAEGENAAIPPYPVFTGDVVSKGSPVWTYENLRYWVIGNGYKFAAVAPANVENLQVTAGLDLNKAAISEVSYTNDGEVDLLYAAAQDVSASNDITGYNTVEFNLGHMLSRVKFEFVNGMNETYNIELSDVTIKDLPTQATINKGEASSEWVAKEGSDIADFVFVMDKGEKANKQSAASAHKYLYPLNVANDYVINFSIKVKDIKTGQYLNGGQALMHNVTIEDLKFVAGYSYTLKTVVDGDNVDPENKLHPIEFNVDSVDKWKPLDDEGNPSFEDTNYNLPEKVKTEKPEGGNENQQ